MEEFYVIGDFSNNRDSDSFVPGERDLDAIEKALQVLTREQKDAEFCVGLHEKEAHERRTGSSTQQEEAMRRIEMDKIERAEREANKKIMRDKQEAKRQEEKQARTRQKERPVVGPMTGAYDQVANGNGACGEDNAEEETTAQSDSPQSDEMRGQSPAQ